MNSTLSQDQPQGIRLSMDDFTAAGDLLPVSDPRFWIRKRDRNSRYRFRVHWIHLIPLILLLILFILWWSSYPGKFPQ